MVQLSHLYMTAGKTIALTIWTFVGKVLSLLFNFCHSFSSKEQASCNFMVTVTICSDFGAQENTVTLRWMKLEPIIWSEVSQKEKHQYSILTHIYGI